MCGAGRCCRRGAAALGRQQHRRVTAIKTWQRWVHGVEVPTRDLLAAYVTLA